MTRPMLRSAPQVLGRPGASGDILQAPPPPVKPKRLQDLIPTRRFFPDQNSFRLRRSRANREGQAGEV